MVVFTCAYVLFYIFGRNINDLLLLLLSVLFILLYFIQA